MKFRSTRGKSPLVSFCEASLQGLAPDCGLYVPETFPVADENTIEKWRSLKYRELFFEILSLFATDEIPTECLKGIIAEGTSKFSEPECAKLVCYSNWGSDPSSPNQNGTTLGILELYHGPTFAFKDFALQFLGSLIQYLLGVRGLKMTMLGATSGDTGSAAIKGFAGKKNVSCAIMFPHKRVSRVQQKQMTTDPNPNIFCLAVDGTFDDCQKILKETFMDRECAEKFRLGSVNSINLARVCAQIVYYFYGVFRFQEAIGSHEPVDVSVPTGNFGNVLAAHYARLMNCPIRKLIVGSNSNDILTRFIRTGKYQMRDVVPTMSPSMDIQVSSNLERFLFEVFGRDGAKTASLFGDLYETGGFEISDNELADVQKWFEGESVDEAETEKYIKHFFRTRGVVLDPHSAVGIAAAEKQLQWPPHPVLCPATAHCAKFADALAKFIDPKELESRQPEPLKCLTNMTERFTVIKPTSQAVKEYLMASVPPAANS